VATEPERLTYVFLMEAFYVTLRLCGVAVDEAVEPLDQQIPVTRFCMNRFDPDVRSDRGGIGLVQVHVRGSLAGDFENMRTGCITCRQVDLPVSHKHRPLLVRSCEREARLEHGYRVPALVPRNGTELVWIDGSIRLRPGGGVLVLPCLRMLYAQRAGTLCPNSGEQLVVVINGYADPSADRFSRRAVGQKICEKPMILDTGGPPAAEWQTR
jgi:hypothetical protein